MPTNTPNTPLTPAEMRQRVATVREAAAALGISVRAVQLRCERGTMRAIKLCGRWLIDRRALDAAMAEGGR